MLSLCFPETFNAALIGKSVLPAVPAENARHLRILFNLLFVKNPKTVAVVKEWPPRVERWVVAAPVQMMEWMTCNFVMAWHVQASGPCCCGRHPITTARTSIMNLSTLLVAMLASCDVVDVHDFQHAHAALLLEDFRRFDVPSTIFIY